MCASDAHHRESIHIMKLLYSTWSVANPYLPRQCGVELAGKLTVRNYSLRLQLTS
jgi:hypothetical protein